MKPEKLDCVEMKRRGSEVVNRRTAGMTFEQEVEYWKHRSEEFQQERKRVLPIVPATGRPITQDEIDDASEAR